MSSGLQCAKVNYIENQGWPQFSNIPYSNVCNQGWRQNNSNFDGNQEYWILLLF